MSDKPKTKTKGGPSFAIMRFLGARGGWLFTRGLAAFFAIGLLAFLFMLGGTAPVVARTLIWLSWAAGSVAALGGLFILLSLLALAFELLIAAVSGPKPKAPPAHTDTTGDRDTLPSSASDRHPARRSPRCWYQTGAQF